MTAKKKSKPRPTRTKRLAATPLTREQRQQADHRRMLDLIAAVKADEEMKAEADWLLMKMLAHEPMVPGSARGGSGMFDAIREILEGDGPDGPAERGGSPTLQRGTDPLDIGR